MSRKAIFTALAVSVVAVGLAAQAPVTNTQLESAILQKLQTDPNVNKFVVTAAVDSGAVKLNGTADTAQEKDEIAAAVQAVPGVKSVDNQISVSADQLASTTPASNSASPIPVAPPGPNSSAVARQAEANDPQTRVQNALAAAPGMDNVGDAVSGPDCTIFGTVNTKADLLRAAQIAQKAAPGMTVHNLILIYKNGGL